MVTISKNRPLDAKFLLDTIQDKTRKSIIRFLIDNSRFGLTAGELNKLLDVSLPTILSHMEILTGSGLVRFEWKKRRGKMVRVYNIVDAILTVQIDLESFVRIPPRSALQELAMSYIDKARETTLPKRILVEDVAKVLECDHKTAVIVFDYMKSTKEDIVKYLSSHALKEFEAMEAFTKEDLKKVLRVDERWATEVIDSLVDSGHFLKDGISFRKFSIEVEEETPSEEDNGLFE